MRTCKECKSNIEHMNMNTIYCSKKCRIKWNYYNNEDFRLKKRLERLDEMGLKIYKIVYNERVIYIGKTTLKLSDKKRNNTSVPKEILDNSSIEIIEYTTDVSRERYWINYYIELGCVLYNKRKGEWLDKKEYYRNYYREYYKNKQN